jgi:hypothetical protein
MGAFGVLDAFGIRVSSALMFYNTAESRNCLLLEPGVPSSRPIHEAPGLAFLSGGLPAADPSLRPRKIAVPGPGCTLMGIARSLLNTFNAAAPRVTAGGPLTDFELAHGLLAYNRAFLGYTGPQPPGVIRWLPTWNAGTYLTLPMELDTTANAWITNLGKVREWAATLTTEDDLALSDANSALPLVIPDRAALTTQVATLLAGAPPAGAPTVATLADSLRTQLLTNPFEAVFRTVELLRQLRDGGPGGAAARSADVVKLIVELCNLSSTQLFQAVAQGTGGNAVLRQFQIAMEDPMLVSSAAPTAADEQRTRAVLAGALGLVEITANSNSWQNVREWGPTVLPQELSLTKAQQIRKDEFGKTFLQAMAFGRSVDISTSAGGTLNKDTGRESLSYIGKSTYNPVDWLAANGAANNIVQRLAPATSATTVPALAIEQAKVGERLRIACRIAGNEGGLDSTQAGDKGIVSFGMQQWAANTDEELSVLFERFRVQAPDHYDLFFGTLGLQTARWDNSAAAADPGAAKKDTANPYGPDPTGKTKADLIHYFPLFATFLNVAAGSKAVAMPPPAKLGGPSPRNAFFGDSKNARKWFARTRLAAILSVDYLRVQYHQAAWRFTRIQHEVSKTVGRTKRTAFDPASTQTYSVDLRGDAALPGTTGTFEYSELFGADMGAAAVLDHHINAPSKVITSVPDAVNRTPGDTVVADGTGRNFNDVWLRRFAINYIAGRILPPDNARARGWGLIRLHDLDHGNPPNPARSLSPDPGTFTGW